MVSTPTTNTCGDGWFGPVVATADCRGGFDFTVLFEASVLNIIPDACFLLLVPIRLLHLSQQSPKVLSSAIRVATLVVSISLAIIQVALISLVATQHSCGGRVVLTGTVLDLVAILAVVILADLGHIRSIRPSFLVSAYLFVTLLLDLTRVRTAWLVPDNRAYSACLSASLAVKSVLLMLENVEKRKWFLPSEKAYSGESVSGPFNRGLFAWLNGLLRNGYSILLTGDALPVIHEKLLSRDLSTRFADSWAGCNQNRQNALLLAVLKCLRWEIVGIAFPRLCVVGFSIAQPFLVGKATTVLQHTESLSLNMGYGLIGATALVFIGIAVSKASYEHLGYRTTTMLRGGLMALVFQHMMDLPLGSTDESSAMSLMGSDIEMLAEYFQSTVCETWANILQLGLATWLLETQMGAVCIAPIAVVIDFTAASFGMGNVVSSRQKTWLESTEKRINFTTALLGSIRNVKILGLTENMGMMIEASRAEELKISKKFRRIQTIRVCMGGNSPAIVGQLATFAAYGIVATIQGSNGLSVSQAVTSLSLINLMINPLSYLLLAIPDTFASIGCLGRIQGFLRNPNRLEQRQFPQLERNPSTSFTNVSGIELSPLPPIPDKQTDLVLSLQNVRFGWKLSPPDRFGITLILESAPTGTLVMIVDSVGSGKSTLLKGLAGETPVLEGELFIKYPDLAFCEQTPWLANASIRDNILGESSLSSVEAGWYSTVISACALDMDFKRMLAGDKTLVGSKGAKLSGGQKQRIAIARALYARRRIACFDDVLSGLDNETARLVFNNVFGPAGLLRRLGCIVFLATHRTHHLPQADLIIVLGEDGQVLEQGSYSQLQSATDGYIQTHGIQAERSEDIEEANDNSNPPLEYLEATADPLTTSSPTDGKRKTTDLAVYKYYFSTLGWLRLSVLIFCLVIDSGMNGIRYVWIDLWSSRNDSGSDSRLGYWLGMYGALSAIQAIALAVAVFWNWVIIVPAASRDLHARVLRACMNAPLSFLSNVETGTLVTRFSQDMRLVDMILPRSSSQQGSVSTSAFCGPRARRRCHSFLALLGKCFAIFVCTVIPNPAVLPAHISPAAAIGVGSPYPSAFTSMIELKSPLYIHFIESLAGVTTLRAFSWTNACTSRMLSMLDTAQKPFYLLLCIQRWLSLVLDLIVAALTVLLVGAAIALRNRVDPGLLGVGLIMMIDLGEVLSKLIQNWTLLETSLGAIARIKEFVEDTPNEERDTTAQTSEQPPEWPSRGEIEFVDASIAYDCSSETKPVLKSVHLHFLPGQKIGLCGRTGSGKSTLALSLLGLNEIQSGQILIDGQDISFIDRSLIRQRISCLSQEPFLFPGTIRQNADPVNVVTDTDIIGALRRVGLWDALTTTCGHGAAVLDAKLDDNILSQSQRQLFCLARALLKKSKILILDEPTSSLDTETDAKVQKVVRELFHDCTVFMVAHRIRTLLDFDVVAVLDSGRVVEVGNPQKLLDRADGSFSKLLVLES